MTPLLIFEGIRLTVWGVAFLMIWKGIMRLRDVFTVRKLMGDEGEVIIALPQDVAKDALLLGGMTLLAFTVGIIQKFSVYLGAGQYPIVGALALWLLFWLECRVLARIAYHRRFVMRWTFCWAVFAHIVAFMPLFA